MIRRPRCCTRICARGRRATSTRWSRCCARTSCSPCPRTAPGFTAPRRWRPFSRCRRSPCAGRAACAGRTRAPTACPRWSGTRPGDDGVFRLHSIQVMRFQDGALAEATNFIGALLPARLRPARDRPRLTVARGLLWFPPGRIAREGTMTRYRVSIGVSLLVAGVVVPRAGRAQDPGQIMQQQMQDQAQQQAQLAAAADAAAPSSRCNRTWIKRSCSCRPPRIGAPW